MTKRLSSTSTTVSLDIRVSMTLKKKIKAAAKEAGMNMSEWIRFKLAE